MKVDHEIPLEPGQKFVVDSFRPEDARGIANLFYSIYGPNYPFDTYYIPEKLIEENRKGNIYSVVARTPKGDIIAHGALYRSSPPYENIYELGQYISLKAYRTTFAIYKINQYIAEKLIDQVGPAGVFGEAVCNHVITQKSSALIGFKDVALEISLMPVETYSKEENAAGRVSCLINFLSCRDRPQEVFIPACYQEEIDYILSDVEFKRTLVLARQEIPPATRTEAVIKFFPFAAVGRINVMLAGADFGEFITEFESQAGKQSIVILQFFLNLEKPWIGKAIDILRDWGYFFGGYVPRWFDSDGILMQKILVHPDFNSITLYSLKAKKIKEYILSDWERTRHN
jgi:hypothetical protein